MLASEVCVLTSQSWWVSMISRRIPFAIVTVVIVMAFEKYSFIGAKDTKKS